MVDVKRTGGRRPGRCPDRQFSFLSGVLPACPVGLGPPEAQFAFCWASASMMHSATQWVSLAEADWPLFPRLGPTSTAIRYPILHGGDATLRAVINEAGLEVLTDSAHVGELDGSRIAEQSVFCTGRCPCAPDRSENGPATTTGGVVDGTVLELEQLVDTAVF